MLTGKFPISTEYYLLAHDMLAFFKTAISLAIGNTFKSEEMFHRFVLFLLLVVDAKTFQRF